MRILHTVPHYEPYVGGMAEVVGQISRELVKKGHEVTVATAFHSERFEKEIDGVNIEAFRIEGNATVGIRGEYRRYREFLLQGHFDIIANFAAPQWTSDLMLPLLDKITAGKVFIPTGFSPLFNPAYTPYFTLLASLMKKYDRNIFTGREYRDFEFACRAGVEKTCIIPNGASAVEFLREYTINIRTQLGIPQNHFLILHVGSFTGLKGHRETMEIFQRAPITNTTLLMVGNRVDYAYGEVEMCQEAVCRFMAAPERQLDHKRMVITSLSREETVMAFKDADLFLFPSNMECSPIVLFECMAAKTPFLTTDVGNAKEIIKWSAGGQVLPTYIDALGFSHALLLEGAALLAQMVQDQDSRFQMAAKGFAAWQESFRWDNIARQYEQLYQEISAKMAGL